MGYHKPVLLDESIDALNVIHNGVYVDVTFGGGGHSNVILQKLSDEGCLIAFDRDLDAKAQVQGDDRLIFVRSNFRYIKRFLDYMDRLPVDGVLADLGVSSFQFDELDRGFSFRDSSKRLDMRMNVESEFDAVDVLNGYSEEELANVFYLYGELRNSRQLAKQICVDRKVKSLVSVGDLMGSVDRVVKSVSPKFLAQLFQALRIEVNQEMQALEDLLMAMGDVIRPGGRLSVISYHSLEDRMVKNYMKTGSVHGELNKDKFGNIFRPFRLVNKKTTIPGNEEIRLNSRARSAKLRVGERVGSKE